MPSGSQNGISNNPKGKGRGTKHKKTEQWEALAESIITTHAERFNNVLTNLDDESFAKIYKDILNYFKPKINHNINEQTEPTKIQFINGSKQYEINEKGESTKKAKNS